MLGLMWAFPERQGPKNCQGISVWLERMPGRSDRGSSLRAGLGRTPSEGQSGQTKQALGADVASNRSAGPADFSPREKLPGQFILRPLSPRSEFSCDVLKNRTLNKKETVPLRVRKDVGLVTEWSRRQDLAWRGFDASLLPSLSFSVSVSRALSTSVFCLALPGFLLSTDRFQMGERQPRTPRSSQPPWDSPESLVSRSFWGQSLCPRKLGTLIGQARVIWLKGMG